MDAGPEEKLLHSKKEDVCDEHVVGIHTDL